MEKERKSTAADLFFSGSADSAEDIAIDPDDPITWWLSRRTQRPASIEFTGQICEYASLLANVPDNKMFYDVQVNADVGAAVAAYFGLDSPGAGADGYNFETEALGGKLLYGQKAMPTIDVREPLIRTPDDLEKLETPTDWLSRGRVRFAIDLIKKNSRVTFAPACFCSVFTLAVNLRGYTGMIRDMRHHPEFAHKLLARLADDILPSYIKMQHEQTGVTVAVGAAAWESFPSLSPDLIDKWVVPYSQRLHENVLKFGVIAVPIGAADYVEENPQRFSKANLFRCFDSQLKMTGGVPALILAQGRTHEIPLEWVADYLKPFKEKGTRVRFLICVNGRLMRDGPIESIQDCIKRFIDVLGRDHDLSIIANIQAGTPPEHVHAAVAAARAYGKLPLADNLDDVDVVIPERESFEEFVHKMSGGKGLRFQRDGSC